MALNTAILTENWSSGNFNDISTRPNAWAKVFPVGATRPISTNGNTGVSAGADYPVRGSETETQTMYMAGPVTSTADIRVSCLMYMDASDTSGNLFLGGRGVGSGATASYYVAKFSNAGFGDHTITCQIYKLLPGGSETPIGTASGSYTATANVNFTAEISIIGSAITATINGTTRASATDTAITAAGKCVFGAFKTTSSDSCMHARPSLVAYQEDATAATINLTGANCSQANTCSTGVVVDVPPGPGVKNLVGAPSSQANTCGTAVVTVTPAQGTITSEVFTNWSNVVQASVTIPHVVVLRFDRTVALSLAGQATNGAGRLILTNAALVAGTDYMLATFNADGSSRGFKKYTAT